jgi:hypothetical protein
MKFLKTKYLFFLPLLLMIIPSCTTDITLDLPQGEEKLVVEGHIEPGQPPFIILTRSTAYFASTSLTDVANTFVHNAVIKVSDGTRTDSLIEINLANLSDPAMKKMILDYFNIKVGSLATGFNFAFYTSNFTDPNSIKGEVGKTYSLTVNAEGKKLTSVTSIPALVVPDSFWVKPPKEQPGNDSMVKLFFRFQDPADQANNYRYFSKRNSGPFYPDRFSSVMDDKLFNGQDIVWTINNSSSQSDTVDRKTHGLYWKGDTVVVKFCTIDAAHRDFWQTFEMAGSSGGPYANPVQIKTNIAGGLGIWGGYGAVYHTVYIPK